MVAVEALRAAGFIVVEAGTADEAAAILTASFETFDAVFSDVEMPGKLDGLGLARLVTQSWPELVVILTSGRVTPVEGDLPACVNFLGKPYDLDRVAALMMEPSLSAAP